MVISRNFIVVFFYLLLEHPVPHQTNSQAELAMIVKEHRKDDTLPHKKHLIDLFLCSFSVNLIMSFLVTIS